MGTPGATVKAANGSNRYVWISAYDHPAGGDSNHTDSWGLLIGFSNDPGVLPTVMVNSIPSPGQFIGDGTTPGLNGVTFIFDWAPSSLVYNPDDASFPFYLYIQAAGMTNGASLQSCILKSSNLFNWVAAAWGPRSLLDASLAYGQITVLQSVIRRGTGDWISFGPVGNIGIFGRGLWSSTDGLTWTCASTIYNVTGHSGVNLSINSGSGTPLRLTASSSIFSGTNGYGLIIVDPTNSAVGLGGYAAAGFLSPEFINVVSGTAVDLTYNNSVTISAAAAPLEFGPISVRQAPAPGVVGGISTFGQNGFAWSTPFLSGSQLYQITGEDARHDFQTTDDGLWVSLTPIDANYNVSQVIPAVRLSSRYDGPYPGPNYLQMVTSYEEEGVSHIYAEVGYPGRHATSYFPFPGATVTGGIGTPTANISVFDVDSLTGGVGYIPIGGYVELVGQILDQISGTPNGAGSYHLENLGGTTYAAHTAGIVINGGAAISSGLGSVSNGYFGQQFIDYFTLAFDSVLASRAAPFGVQCSCTNNVVTISWMTTPLGTGAETQGYNVYFGTTAGTQAVGLSGNPYTGTSATHTPGTPGQIYWYKVVKVSGGVEQTSKYRVVHTYVG
jgi:hypothetical protein